MRAAAVIALVLMFFLSGLNKTMTFQSTVRALESKGWTVAPPLFIVGTIALELVAPVVIILHALGLIDTPLLNAASIVGLIVFTVIATLVFHRPTLKSYMANVPFLSNVSLVGGLALLLVDGTPA